MTALSLHFRDRRPPHQIQFQLERDLMTLLTPVESSPALLTVAATLPLGDAPCRVLLRFEAALLLTNCYWFQMETPPGSRDLKGWFDFYTRDFQQRAPPEPGAGSASRYRRIVEQSLAAETHLTGVDAIQREIVEEMHGGAWFSTAHKEGGSSIRYLRGRFVRADFGESSLAETYATEAEFLQFLRKFYDWETRRHVYPEKVPEYTAWKLILRLLRHD